MLARMAPRLRLRRREGLLEEGEQGTREPEIIIRLTSKSGCVQNEVRYDLTSGIYQHILDDDLTFNLLTLPSRVILRDQQEFISNTTKDEVDEVTEGRRLMAEVYRDMISEEELARLESQHNPFNFSERVSQTNRFPLRSQGAQTEPPPSNCFSANTGPAEIHEAYSEEFDQTFQSNERERDEERERDRDTTRDETPPAPAYDSLVPPPPLKKEKHRGLVGLGRAVKVVERMVTQNIYDDISQDFRYWEDGSDEFRPLEGSLLPLWKFHHDRSRCLVLADVCWSPHYTDLFAAAYSPGGEGIACSGCGSGGMLCLYTLKNPATPERVYRAPCGVTCIAFHPKHKSVVAGGWSDGTVVMYDVRSPATLPLTILSTTLTGKHLLGVAQVYWLDTGSGEDLCLYSVALDGRVTQWLLHTTNLLHSDLLTFPSTSPPPSLHHQHHHHFTRIPPQEQISLEGIGTCLAFRPGDNETLLVGVDTGAVFEVSTHATTHALTRYSAHTACVRAVAWNTHHTLTFLSCSLDWTIKVWFQGQLSPLIVLDVGGAVAAASWSPYNSSVLVAVTEEGRVAVYDLSVRRCRPLCVQSLVQRRRVAASCVAFCPFHPIILVGGEKGNLLSLKLSPNLRRVHKDAKGADEKTLREIEWCKMERLVATNRG
ncbi:hypothetical protein Pmani_001559 [Petrolisthes manimaculis]|uniref:Dynein intermediate chain 2, ciliary n=1 Tax=Petrolisthes manimaculis TaxID=1843537 RepID=A0AAE1UPD9_9EUCA|nr:hypothetical protein Pmani_001559 [Petrolisthes manimaculis]